jgi:hypothetical protein
MQKFDPKKLTLTTFNPTAFKAATSKFNLTGKGQTAASIPPGSTSFHPPADPSSPPVPKGRTTHRLSMLRGVVSGDQAPPGPAAPPVHKEPVQPHTRSHVLQDTPAPLHPDTPKASLDNSDASPGLPVDVDTPPDFEYPAPSDLPEDAGVVIRTAAIKSRVSRKPPVDPNDPNAMILVPTRVPKWLKDAFYKTSREKNMTPSLVIRSLMKSFCGLCLLLAFTLQAAETPSKTYSTPDLISYFEGKVFSATTLLPGFKTTASVRHSLWETGGRDSTDYIYADHSNTRLEARIDIPLLDLSYLRDRTRDKNELRSMVMKSLTRILAAQKTVAVQTERLNGLSARLSYTRTQVTLKLANKSDLFPLEDQFYNLQAQLFESQATLDQRIIELASIAGDDWKEGYTMITKWDGKLF